jgi:high-affinity nickel permease
MFAFLCAVNIVIWVVSVIVYKPYPSMLGTGALAYTLGLRHAVDAGKLWFNDLGGVRTLTDFYTCHCRSYFSNRQCYPETIER